MKQEQFMYYGYHFIPLRMLNYHERRAGLKKFSRYIRSNSLGISDYNGSCNYSYTDFYKASKESECDIFRCVEDNKLYIPGDNELFEYTEMERSLTKEDYK